jgi:hypothetical protein
MGCGEKFIDVEMFVVVRTFIHSMLRQSVARLGYKIVLLHWLSINDPAHFHPPYPLRYSPNKSNPPSQTNVGSWQCLQRLVDYMQKSFSKEKVKYLLSS